MSNVVTGYLPNFFMNNEIDEFHNLYPPLSNEDKETFCLQIEKMKSGSDNELSYLECCLIMCEHYDIPEETFADYITGELKDSLELEGINNHVVKGKKPSDFTFDNWA